MSSYYLSAIMRNFAICLIAPLLLANVKLLQISEDSVLEDTKDSAASESVTTDESPEYNSIIDSVPLPLSDIYDDDSQYDTKLQFAALPAGTRLKVFLNEELSSKVAKPGDIFDVTVLEDVIINNIVVIPGGTPGFGEVLFANDRGAFGRAGLLDIRLNYLLLEGIEVPLHGRFRQEGKNNNGATVATWVAVGIFSGFITGKEGIMPQGQELRTKVITDVKIPIATSTGNKFLEKCDNKTPAPDSNSLYDSSNADALIVCNIENINQPSYDDTKIVDEKSIPRTADETLMSNE